MDQHDHPVTYQQAAAEAERCLQCFNPPCMEACPTSIDIPTFIWMIRSGNIRGASEVVRTSNAMANVCGKVCPEEIYCQFVCNRAGLDAPIQIRELHFFATQYEAHRGYSALAKFPHGKKTLAVIGGGPAGLGCAFEAAKLGLHVTVYDRKGLGGVPASAIPSFRLSERELGDDLRFLSEHFSLKKEPVTLAKIDSLRRKFDAVFVSVGLGEDRPLGIGGEDLKGVIPVLKFLEAARSGKRKIQVGKRVLVVGGGNVSLDAAATAKRLGASEVLLVYRRSEREMKVWRSELMEARNQGVEIRFLTIPVGITGGKKVAGVRCRRTVLSRRKDGSGRPIPVEVKGSDFTVAADMVIIAVGQVIRSDVLRRFRRDRRGFISVDGRFRTSVQGVFAGGDAISGEGTIAQSVSHGKRAAREIHRYLNGTGKRPS